MNASSWSLRNLPWFKATLAQWRYALRNTIAMCLALTVAYYLNLDEPYWAMTSAAVVSFPTVGGVISKSLGRIAGSLLGAIAALLLAGHTLNEPWFFLLSMSAWLGFCTWACAHFTNNVAYAFQLAGYTAAIIAFPMVNITEASQLWDIAQARVCEVIVGILCGGMMMMILPSSSDATALLTALKNAGIPQLIGAQAELSQGWVGSERRADVLASHLSEATVVQPDHLVLLDQGEKLHPPGITQLLTLDVKTHMYISFLKLNKIISRGELLSAHNSPIVSRINFAGSRSRSSTPDASWPASPAPQVRLLAPISPTSPMGKIGLATSGS